MFSLGLSSAEGCNPFSAVSNGFVSLKGVIPSSCSALGNEAHHKTWRLRWLVHLARELELLLPSASPPKWSVPEWVVETWGTGELVLEGSSESWANGEVQRLGTCSVWCTGDPRCLQSSFCLGFGQWKAVQSGSWPPGIQCSAVAEMSRAGCSRSVCLGAWGRTSVLLVVHESQQREHKNVTFTQGLCGRAKCEDCTPSLQAEDDHCCGESVKRVFVNFCTWAGS